jgi:catechol 2,3-dioxygenase-like lactoylglutathione lyase family enzyme
MIDHVGLKVSDVERSRRFYEAALAPLGYRVLMDFGEFAIGFGGANGKADFWIGVSEPVTVCHLAFASPDRATVKAFHAAALAAGGRDNGAPGLRGHYHPDYYGAFVLDPDGNNVEAVCHAPVS